MRYLATGHILDPQNRTVAFFLFLRRAPPLASPHLPRAPAPATTTTATTRTRAPARACAHQRRETVRNRDRRRVHITLEASRNDVSCKEWLP